MCILNFIFTPIIKIQIFEKPLLALKNFVPKGRFPIFHKFLRIYKISGDNFPKGDFLVWQIKCFFHKFNQVFLIKLIKLIQFYYLSNLIIKLKQNGLHRDRPPS